MKIIFSLLVLAITFIKAYCQEISVVKGKFSNIEYSKIKLQTDENPFTGPRDEFEAILLDSGKFEIYAELYVPTMFKLLIDNILAARIFLCPGNNLIIKVDSSGLNMEGTTGDFNKWGKVLESDYLHKYNIGYAESQGIDAENIEDITAYLFNLREKNISKLIRTRDNLALDNCEFNYFKSRVNYTLYAYLWSELIQQKYPIESDAYQFMDKLPLDDISAAKISLDYNRAVSVIYS